MRIFQDSCQLYGTNEIGLRYSNNSSTVNATNSRRGGPCLTGTGSNSRTVTRVLGSTPSELYVAFAFKCSSMWSNPLIGFYEGATLHVSIELTSAGALSAYRSTTLLDSTESGIILQNVYIQLQVYVKIADSPNGVITIRANGSTTPILNLTGIDTRNAGTGVIDRVLFTTCGSTTLFGYIHDIVINDTTGSYNNTWPGDVKVNAYVPNGNGANNGWTPSSAVDRYTTVDEQPCNTSDYIESSTPDELCTMAFPSLGSAGIQALQTVIYGQKTDAGARSVAPVFRSGGVDRAGSTVNLGDSYQYLVEIYETDPSDSQPWDAGVTPEAGVKLVA